MDYQSWLSDNFWVKLTFLSTPCAHNAGAILWLPQRPCDTLNVILQSDRWLLYRGNDKGANTYCGGCGIVIFCDICVKSQFLKISMMNHNFCASLHHIKIFYISTIENSGETSVQRLTWLIIYKLTKRCKTWPNVIKLDKTLILVFTKVFTAQ